MRNQPTSELLSQLIRGRICASCPNLSREDPPCGITLPHTCERDCPLFAQLQTLVGISRYMDPMLGSPRHVIERMPLNGVGRSLAQVRSELVRIVEEVARRREKKLRTHMKES